MTQLLDSTSDESDWLALFDAAVTKVGISPSDLPAIRSSISTSMSLIHNARQACADISSPSNSSLIAFGSLARHEFTPASDLDYLLTYSGSVDSAPEEFLQQAVSLIRSVAPDLALSDPGTSGLFGSCVDTEEIASNIGLQGDSNHNLTRRILLLEESVAVTGLAHHRENLERVAARYLEAKSSNSPTRTPRVLLNDMVRYWRTITIDYHAKTSRTQRYSMRYLKLLFSRKLCFVSSIAPLFFLQLDDKEVTSETLTSSFTTPSIIRLVEFLARVSELGDSGIRELSCEIISLFESFQSCVGSAEWRQTVVREIECYADPKLAPEFGQMRSKGKEMHDSLTSLLTSGPMIDFTREYLLI